MCDRVVLKNRDISVFYIIIIIIIIIWSLDQKLCRWNIFCTEFLNNY
jgi:hypothetical protein